MNAQSEIIQDVRARIDQEYHALSRVQMADRRSSVHVYADASWIDLAQVPRMRFHHACAVVDAHNGWGPILVEPPLANWLPGDAGMPWDDGLHRDGILAVMAVRKRGGVLLHPHQSRLWSAMGIPEPGKVDQWGGYTLETIKGWYPDAVESRTRVYVRGVHPANLPPGPVDESGWVWSLGGTRAMPLFVGPGEWERSAWAVQQEAVPLWWAWIGHIALRSADAAKWEGVH